MALTTGSGRMVAVGRRLAAGGEGEVFTLTSPPGLVFKRYLRTAQGRDPGLEWRLHAMVAHPPAEWREPSSGHVTLAWPSDLVFEDGRFVGFLMSAVDMDNTVSLHRVTNPTDRSAATGATSWAQGFTWRYLVHSAANLAHAIGILHRSGVVVGDFNESNVRVSREARVTLLDCDSMQISDPVSGERFFTGVGRPEWTPPELLNADWKTTVRYPSSDLFALAIHLYQLLLEGEHPFRGVWSGADDKPSVPELARQGIWAYRRSGPLSPRPSAIGIGLLPSTVVAMFRKAFEDGADSPAARPTAVEWQQAMADLEADLRQCTADQAHFYPRNHTTCPWCRRPRRSGSQTPLPPAAAPTPPPWAQIPPQPVPLIPHFNPQPVVQRPTPAVGPVSPQPPRSVVRRRRRSALVGGAITLAIVATITSVILANSRTPTASNPATTVPVSQPVVHPSPAKRVPIKIAAPFPPTHAQLICNLSLTSSYANDGNDCTSRKMYSGDDIVLDVSGITQGVVSRLCKMGYTDEWTSRVGSSYIDYAGLETGMCTQLSEGVLPIDNDNGFLVADFSNPEVLGMETVTWRLISPSGKTVLVARYSFDVLEDNSYELPTPPS